MRLSEALDLTERVRFARLASGEQAIQRARRCVRWLGDRPAARVTVADLNRLVGAMALAGLAPASQNRYLAALSAVLATAGVERALPWQREPKGRSRALTPTEVASLAQACLPRRRGPAIAALVRFLAETGLRLGEATALRWTDLELDGARPHATVATSKNGDPRWVPLTQEAVQAARTQLAPSSTGPWHRLSHSVVDHAFRAARESVTTTRGDREVVVHALRHTCATRLVQAGVATPVVGAWLGHRDYRSTLRYVHPNQDGLLQAMRRLEGCA